MNFDFPTKLIEEGAVKIMVPEINARNQAPSKAAVFYNPVMALNRDMAVLALQTYQRNKGPGLFICEPLTGCGVRGIRFAKEVEGINEVVVSDINPKATELAKTNAERNGLTEQISVLNEDANLLLSSHSGPRERFDFIDVDPFGSPVLYLDSAIRALRDGGLLALTATDMAPLCGVHPRACIRKYGGRSLRTEYCHELAVRFLLGCLVTTAAKHDLGIETVFSHRTDHYIRAYAISHCGAKHADRSIQQMGYILHCFKCLHRETSQGLFPFLDSKCPECGSNISVAGPLWLGKLTDKTFCSQMENEIDGRKLEKTERALKLLSAVQAEADSPVTYFVIDNICDRLNLPVPPLKSVVKGLIIAGFQATTTHFNSKGVKTNASAKEIKEVVSKLQRFH